MSETIVNLNAGGRCAPPIGSAAFARKMIDAPANCVKCKAHHISPTTGKLMNDCYCGGELIPETKRQNNEVRSGACADK